jgi:hypothetical protein
MKTRPSQPRPELEALLKKAAADFAAMTPEQREAISKIQCEGYVRAEMSWPRDCPYR